MDPFVLPAKLERQLETVEAIVESLFMLQKASPILVQKLHQMESYVTDIPSECFYQVFVWRTKLANWWREFAIIQLDSNDDQHLQQAPQQALLAVDRDTDALEPRTSTPINSTVEVIPSDNINLEELAFQQVLNRRTSLSSEPRSQRTPLLNTPILGYPEFCYENACFPYNPFRTAFQYNQYGAMINEPVRICQFCREEGHFKENCMKLRNTKCGKCNLLGHTTKFCRAW